MDDFLPKDFISVAGHARDTNVIESITPSIEVPALYDPQKSYMANQKYENLIEDIEKFQNKLDDEHEVALYLAHFGASMIMAVEDIGYTNPDLLYFHGTVNGNEATLVQHMSQLNFLLVSVKKPDSDKLARRIGFMHAENKNTEK